MTARTVFPLAALAAALAAPAQAQVVWVQTPAVAPSPAKPEAPRATVVRDAATGRLRAPTAEEAAELAAAAPPSNARAARRASPQEARQSNGAVGLEVDESSMLYSVARRQPDGTVSTVCVPAATAKSMLRSTARTVAGKAVSKEGALELQ
jgi:hypothetical protein